MSTLPLTITSITAILLAALYVFQTFSVIAVRRSAGIPFGHGKDAEDRKLLKRARGHSNMAEQMPLFLILVGLMEFQGLMPASALIPLAALFVIGRALHAIYFLDIGLTHRLRLFGMLFTLIAQIIAVVLLGIGLLAA
ncbi:MAG: MAPEG family protein [Pseudomonadota bacterium]